MAVTYTDETRIHSGTSVIHVVCGV